MIEELNAASSDLPQPFIIPGLSIRHGKGRQRTDVAIKLPTSIQPVQNTGHVQATEEESTENTEPVQNTDPMQNTEESTENSKKSKKGKKRRAETGNDDQPVEKSEKYKAIVALIEKILRLLGCLKTCDEGHPYILLWFGVF
jgi:hypothetical protein